MFLPNCFVISMKLANLAGVRALRNVSKALLSMVRVGDAALSISLVLTTLIFFLDGTNIC